MATKKTSTKGTSISRKASRKKAASKTPIKAQKKAKPTATSSDKRKTKDQLIKELVELSRENTRLNKKSDADYEKTDFSDYYEALLKHSTDYILVSDKNGVPVLFNEAYKKIIKEALGINMKAGLVPHKLLPDKKQVQWWDDVHKRANSKRRFLGIAKVD